MISPLEVLTIAAATLPALVGIVVVGYLVFLVRRLVVAQERTAEATERLVEALRTAPRS